MDASLSRKSRSDSIRPWVPWVIAPRDASARPRRNSLGFLGLDADPVIRAVPGRNAVLSSTALAVVSAAFAEQLIQVADEALRAVAVMRAGGVVVVALVALLIAESAVATLPVGFAAAALDALACGIHAESALRAVHSLAEVVAQACEVVTDEIALVLGVGDAPRVAVAVAHAGDAPLVEAERLIG